MTFERGQAAQKHVSEPPHLVLVSAVIYTGDPPRRRAEAIAIQGERIVAVGSNREIRALAGAKTRVVDLHGRFAMPGFNDAHSHLANGGQARLQIDFEGAKSLAEFQQRIRARLNEYKPGEWITGRGWDHTLWPEQRFPTRRDLDAVSAVHPMIFWRVDGHVAVANSLAFETAGIARETKNPEGGKIERDAAGEPTGILKENAIGLVQRRVPPLTPAQRRHGIELALAEAARFGVSSLQDNSSWADFLVYAELKKEGKLTARITEWLPFTARSDRADAARGRHKRPVAQDRSSTARSARALRRCWRPTRTTLRRAASCALLQNSSSAWPSSVTRQAFSWRFMPSVTAQTGCASMPSPPHAPRMGRATVTTASSMRRSSPRKTLHGSPTWV